MHKFPKSERLSSKLIIEELFSKGQSFYIEPFKIIWLEYPLNFNLETQVLIAVSKRYIKKAVHRNKIKRRIKEAYRLQKYQLLNALSNSGKQYVFALLYTSKQINDYHAIKNKILLILQRLEKEINI